MACYTDLSFNRKQIRFELEILISVGNSETRNEERYNEALNDFCKKWEIPIDTVLTWIKNNK